MTSVLRAGHGNEGLQRAVFVMLRVETHWQVIKSIEWATDSASKKEIKQARIRQCALHSSQVVRLWCNECVSIVWQAVYR